MALDHSKMGSEAQGIHCGLRQWLQFRQTAPAHPVSRPPIPRLSLERQQASLNDGPLDLKTLTTTSATAADQSKTVLYLGYASNLSAETFQGKRQIHPISQINVVVPSIQLTFDLPGVPYAEPCFGNVRYRDPPTISIATNQTPSEKPKQPPYHKDRWPKGLVGVVYEVTQSDYAHIIATEGGGASYKDVLVDAYALSADPGAAVPDHPETHGLTPLKTHTLFSPPRVTRPNGPSYAQPSARYLKLIADGAAEHALPTEYRAFLAGIRPYTITRSRQRLGSWLFLALWAPLFIFIIGGAGAVFLDKNGRYPAWYVALVNAVFRACWGSYDNFFRGGFGDGERTRYQGGDEEMAGGGGGGSGRTGEGGYDGVGGGGEKAGLLSEVREGALSEAEDERRRMDYGAA